MALISCESKRSWTAYLPMPDGTVRRYEDRGKDALGRIIRLWVMEKRASEEVEKIKNNLKLQAI